MLVMVAVLLLLVWLIGLLSGLVVGIGVHVLLLLALAAGAVAVVRSVSRRRAGRPRARG